MAIGANEPAVDAKSGCRLAADELMRRVAEVSDLLEQAAEFQECDDGYVFKFPGHAVAARQLLDFIVAERQCCRFMTFDLTFQPDQGPIDVRIGGSEKLRVLLRAVSVTSGDSS